MLKIIFLTAFAVVSVFAEGELSILYHPDSIIFHGKDRINQSFITDLFTSVLGLTVIPSDDNETANKVDVVDHFRLPKALVNIVVKGIDSLRLPNHSTYPVNTDRAESDTWQDIDEILTERNANSTLIRIESSSDIASFDRLDLSEKNVREVNQTLLQHLDLNVVTDYRESLRMLYLAANNIQAKNIDDNGPAVYWFIVSGLSSVIDRYGADSPAVAEARDALNKALKHVSNAFVEAYQGKVVVAVLTNDGTDSSQEIRRIRRDLKPTEDSQNDDMNLATKYSADYPAIFNITLWFGVGFLFSLIAICIAIADMDPGRDSIIYRMTSNRMKKDN